MRAASLILLLYCLLPCLTFAQGTGSPTFKMDGKAALLTNYVEHGITQTDKDPALHGQFWFNWGPQFRLGLWGSNLKYENSDSHFLLKINADLKVSFSADTDMTIKYSDNHYFKPETRNGNTLGLHLNLYTYGILYDVHSNFLGTEDKATSFGFTKTWPAFGDWQWENLIGYMTVDSETLANYFWYETYLGKRPGLILYQVGLSLNSNAAQFNGAGELAILGKATVSF